MGAGAPPTSPPSPSKSPPNPIIQMSRSKVWYSEREKEKEKEKECMEGVAGAEVLRLQFNFLTQHESEL